MTDALASNECQVHSLIPLFLARYSSKETRRTYASTLQEFLLFAQELLETNDRPLLFSQVSEELLLRYRNHLGPTSAPVSAGSRKGVGSSRPKGHMQTTLARKVSTLRSFFSYAHKRKLLDSDHSQELKPPRVQRKSRTRSLTPDETVAIVSQLDLMRRSAKPRSRNQRALDLGHAVIVTLLTTGLRVSELCGLCRGDFVPGKLTLIRKGGQAQSILLHPVTTQVIENYLQTYCGQPPNGEPQVRGPLFVRSQNIRPTLVHSIHLKKNGFLTPKAVWLMVTKAARNAGITELPSPHSFRATVATELHKQGVLLHQIQDLLGHSSPTTTTLYIKKLREFEDSPSAKLHLFESI